MFSEDIRLIFDLPDGRLLFANGDLDVWAEHLTWCYRFLGVEEGATIAVQDFGTSPLSFLGSALLMPTLKAGVAERLSGRFICLDASSEKVTLTPAVMTQITVDVLVVRSEVVNLLLEVSRRVGLDLEDGKHTMIVAFNGEQPVRRREKAWSYLLEVEPTLLLAPQCRSCGCFHLRAGFYALAGEQVRNLRLPSAQPHRFRRLEAAKRGGCKLSPDDWCIRLPMDAEA